MRKLFSTKLRHNSAITYAAMEFMPTTTNGNAMPRCFLTSTTQENAARKKKHTPPLNSVHAGGQMRFTSGQMPVTGGSKPAAHSTTAANRTFRKGIFGANTVQRRRVFILSCRVF